MNSRLRDRHQQASGRQVLSWGVFLLVLGGVWFVAAPTNLGGPASFVIVEGTSMEPTYQDGDLVIARQESSYEVGDVITYDAPVGTEFPVIHRVIGFEEGGYITQGDNRDRPDGWLAPKHAVHGSSWIHIPYGGIAAQLLRSPSVLMALLGGWITLALLNRDERRKASSGTGADSSEGPLRDQAAQVSSPKVPSNA